MVSRSLAGLRVGLLGVLAVAGCTDEVVVTPVIDSPVDDPEAAAFPDLDEVAITIARSGSDRELVAYTFQRGDTLEVGGAPFGEDLVIHMSGFRGGGTSAYGRTCAFAVDPEREPPRPHLFFSRIAKFASTGIFPLERQGGGAVSIDGSAMLIGGTIGGVPSPDVELFDPRTGELVVVGSVTQRSGAVGALLGTSPARLVLVGGQRGAFGASFVEVFEPMRQVEVIDDLRMARLGITATSLTDGRVISIGGHSPGAAPLGAITEISVSGASFPIRDTRVVLAQPRTGHTATRLGDDLGAPVLIAGGTTGIDGTGAPVAIAELFKPLTEELARPATFAPEMLVPRSRHHATLMPDNSVLFIGGIDAAGNPVRTLELFTLDAGFVAVGELPVSAAVVDATVTVLPDGGILIAGGRTEPGAAPTSMAFIARLDPSDGSVDVLPIDALATPRAGHQAARLCDGTVLLTGGTDGASVAERYNPTVDARR